MLKLYFRASFLYRQIKQIFVFLGIHIFTWPWDTCEFKLFVFLSIYLSNRCAGDAMARGSEHELDEPSSSFGREQDIHIRINAL